MKELSIEQKAKAYDEAIERAKKVLLDCTSEEQKVVEYITPELKESDDERIRKELIEFIHHRKVMGSITPEESKKSVSWISWLEKQGEQKPAGKVEPKFKIGDWVVRNGKTLQISGIDTVLDGTFHYWFTKGTWLSSKKMENAMLWTIQDAKEGDVLVVNNEVFIYAHRKQMYSIAVAHCFVDSAGGFYFDGEFGYTENGNSIHPATKEQRDLLFQKMHEAGYTFDFEKKELKKIEQKPASFEIPLLEKFKQAVYDCAWGKVTCKSEGETQEEYAERWAEQLLSIVRDWADDYIDYTIQQKLRKSYDKGKEDAIKENSSAWSEEDETVLDNLIYALANDRIGNDRDEYVDWLKSLKDRVQPQPNPEWSDEDDVMANAINGSLFCYASKLRDEGDSILADNVEKERKWLTIKFIKN